MPVERREQAIDIESGQPMSGPTRGGRNPMFNGRRQPSCGGTSRMMREYQVRICERLGVKFPGPTRHSLPMRLVPRLARCPQYPESRHEAPAQYLTRWANSGLMRRSKKERYSITSSARARSVGGIVRSRAFAVVRLRTRSNLVGCSTGMSPGFAPRRILSTISAVRLHWSRKFGP